MIHHRRSPPAPKTCGEEARTHTHKIPTDRIYFLSKLNYLLKLFPSEILPGCVVDERQLAEIVAVLQRRDNALAVDDDVNGAFEYNVPRHAFVSLIKHCGYIAKKRKKRKIRIRIACQLPPFFLCGGRSSFKGKKIVEKKQTKKLDVISHWREARNTHTQKHKR